MKIDFIRGNSTELIFVLRETIKIHLNHEEAKKINSISENSEDTPFNNCERQKSFFLDWKSLRSKSADGKIMEETKTIWDFLGKRLHWLKIRGYHFAWKITMETIWIDLKATKMSFIVGNFVKLCSIGVGSKDIAFIIGEAITKNHFIDENARWTDFKQMQCNETGFFGRNSMQLDMVDEKSMETDFNYQQARRTNFVEG